MTNQLKIKAIKGKDIVGNDGKEIGSDFFSMYLEPAISSLAKKNRKESMIFSVTTATVLLGSTFVSLELEPDELDDFLSEVKENILRIYQVHKLARTADTLKNSLSSDHLRESLLNSLKDLKESLQEYKGKEITEEERERIVEKAANKFMSAITGDDDDFSSDTVSTDRKIRILPPLLDSEKWSCCESCENVEPTHFMNVIGKEKLNKIKAIKVEAEFYYTCQNGHILTVIDENGEKVEFEEFNYNNPENDHDFDVEKLKEHYEALKERYEVSKNSLSGSEIALSGRLDIGLSSINKITNVKADYRMNQIKALLDIDESLSKHRKTVLKEKYS